MLRSLTGVRTVLAIAVGATAICLSSAAAFGTGVQVSFVPFFNADDILRYSGGTFTVPSTSWDSPLQTPSDSFVITQSAANQLAGGGGGGIGINDSGTYLANGAQTYDVVMGFTNATPTGTNTVLRETTVGSTFTFNVPSNNYSQFAIFGSSGNGSSTLQITLNYTTGSPTVLTGVTFPDWFSGNPGNSAASAAGTYFALTPAMSRDHVTGGYQAPDSPAGAFIYGINLGPDPTRTLTSVTVLTTALAEPGLTAANFLTAAGTVAPSTPSATPAPGTLILALLGLSLVCWFFMRARRKAAF